MKTLFLKLILDENRNTFLWRNKYSFVGCIHIIRFIFSDQNNLEAGTKRCCIPKLKNAKQKICKKCCKLQAFTF